MSCSAVLCDVHGNVQFLPRVRPSVFDSGISGELLEYHGAIASVTTGLVGVVVAVPGLPVDGRVDEPEVDIDQRDQVLPSLHDLGRVGSALAAAADDRDGDPLARRQLAQRHPEHGPERPSRRRRHQPFRRRNPVC